ncbi:hypothetical protein [Nostoc linckia]|uniref:hypothetical protein n=1 Tax=Nostoc linckia TaxID=92942 RepID=UPI000BFF9FB6
MQHILLTLFTGDFLTNLAAGELNITTEFIWLITGIVLSMIGGAIGGMLLAGKDIGYEFSAILGALFAPAGVIPATAIATTVGSLLLVLFAQAEIPFCLPVTISSFVTGMMMPFLLKDFKTK